MALPALGYLVLKRVESFVISLGLGGLGGLGGAGVESMRLRGWLQVSL